MKDREALFNEFVAAARKKEKEDSKTRGEKVRWFVSNGLFGGVGLMIILFPCRHEQLDQCFAQLLV